jgi:hypothetical protein
MQIMLATRPGFGGGQPVPAAGLRRVMAAILVLAAGLAESNRAAGAPEPVVSKETQECLNCHSQYQPGLVHDWMESLHSKVTPEEGLKKRPLERRVSSENIPAPLQGVVVG